MSIVDIAFKKLRTRMDEKCEHGRIAPSERVLSVVAGGFVLGFSARRVLTSPLGAISGITLGGALVIRGVTGKCAIKKIVEDEEEKNRVTMIERRYYENKPV